MAVEASVWNARRHWGEQQEKRESKASGGQEKELETAACSPHFPKPGQQSRTDERAKGCYVSLRRRGQLGVLTRDNGQLLQCNQRGSGKRPGPGRVVGKKTAPRCYDASGAGADCSEEKEFFFLMAMSSRSASRCRSLNPICSGSVWSHCSLGQV